VAKYGELNGSTAGGAALICAFPAVWHWVLDAPVSTQLGALAAAAAIGARATAMAAAAGAIKTRAKKSGSVSHDDGCRSLAFLFCHFRIA
jgi:hypothetical protein